MAQDGNSTVQAMSVHYSFCRGVAPLRFFPSFAILKGWSALPWLVHFDMARRQRISISATQRLKPQQRTHRGGGGGTLDLNWRPTLGSQCGCTGQDCLHHERLQKIDFCHKESPLLCLLAHTCTKARRPLNGPIYVQASW